MTNQNPTTGAGNIKKFLMTSNKGQGKTADLSGGLVEYSYYESVLSNHITATAVIVETGVGQKGAQKGILDDLPIRGGERTLIEVTDSSSKQTPITLPDGLYVNRVRGSIPESQQDVYAIDFASKEYFLNEQSRVMKRYEGKISDNVETILNDVLKTTGSVEVDETSLPYNFYGMNKKPFYICTWLASKGVPTRVWRRLVDFYSSKLVKDCSSSPLIVYLDKRQVRNSFIITLVFSLRSMMRTFFRSKSKVTLSWINNSTWELTTPERSSLTCSISPMK